ncbi:MAG TPA: PAS domain S-box protein [Acetobacteraceae bacterium]|nr:PAS domain S-box protein [Acetobacteraceae bacterium]
MVLERIHEGSDGLVIGSANDAFCRISGHAVTDLVGRPFASLAAPDSIPASWNAALAAAHDQKSFRSELLCGRPDGRTFWFGLHIMPTARGGPRFNVVLGRDITAARLDRQQQASVQGLLAKVFASVPTAVGILEEHGVIVMTNPALDSLLGFAPGGLVGKGDVDQVAPEDRTALLAARQRQIESGLPYTIKFKALHADGSRIPVKFSSTLVEREDLKRFRIVTVTPTAVDTDSPPVTVHIAGKIKLIGLEEVRAALGSRWPAVAERAMAVAEHVVKRRCGPRDTWARTTDSGIVICFGETTEEEAALRATAIARDIRARLIGEGEEPGRAEVSAVTSAVELVDENGRPVDTLAEALGRRLNARLAEFEQRARETLRVATQSVTCELAAIHDHTIYRDIGHFATLPRRLEDRVCSALAVLPTAARGEFEFDRLVLGAAAEHVIQKIASGAPPLILVPFDFDLFLDRQRMERYLATCRAVDARLRQHLILVLSNLPRGVPRSRVQECVMRLRPLCQMVAFQSADIDCPAVEFSALNGSIVVLSETDMNRFDARSLAKLQKLIGLTRAQRARILVRQVGTTDAGRRLLKLGVNLIALANNP